MAMHDRPKESDVRGYPTQPLNWRRAELPRMPDFVTRPQNTHCASRHARLPHMPEFVRLPHNPMLSTVLGTTAATTAVSTL